MEKIKQNKTKLYIAENVQSAARWHGRHASPPLSETQYIREMHGKRNDYNATLGFDQRFDQKLIFAVLQINCDLYAIIAVVLVHFTPDD